MSFLFQISVALFLAVAAFVAAAPQQQPNQPVIPILKYDNEGANFDGSYKWRYIYFWDFEVWCWILVLNEEEYNSPRVMNNLVPSYYHQRHKNDFI